jgi:ribonucleoside-diphosphate reductase beta chain
MRDVARAGVEPDPDLVYRALPYAVDPEWTRGHRFTIAYEMEGAPEGPWYVHVDDGSVSVSTEDPGAEPDSRVSLARDTWLQLVRGDISPNEAMRAQLVRVEGKMFPVTILGRWIERSEGRDDAELEREQRQRLVQEGRLTWGAGRNGAVPHGQGDPAEQRENGAKRRSGPSLLAYEDLYALWERQNWSAHEIDFSVDREQWLATPTASQVDTAWSLASFYIGEERVTADLAPFLLAAPSGEVELFLATQLVDEARHTAMFDRFGSEVMALSGDDLRSRLRELERTMLSPWRELFDGALHEIAERIKAKPDDLDLFVDGIVTYHMVIEGVLAMTGQRLIGQYMEDHDLYPGFVKGFSLIERDEHRHIAFGVRFLKDALDQDPSYGDRIVNRVAELVPRAAHVFVPPYADSAKEFVSYGYDSRQIYGYAYRSLKRRMGVLGLECPPAEELMPGPIEEPATPAAA